MICLRVLLLCLCLAGYVASAQYVRPEPLFAPAAGQSGSTAVYWQDSRIQGWATGYISYLPGSDVDTSWQHPEQALGSAGESVFEVTPLGRGGQITLSFYLPVVNGPGPDIVVFENGFDDDFLELAFVEVSSDGIHFFRFPGYSYTPDPVGSNGSLQPTLITGLASKYRLGYGTPFDLQVLQDAYDLAVTKEVWNGFSALEFSQQYRDHLVSNFDKLDIQAITHIRVIDIIGDGSALDCEGAVIYDPYPTSISAGFDLDGVAVLNQQQPAGIAQFIHFPRIPHQRISKGQLFLDASSTSGLPVQYNLISGPAALSGNLLTFTGKGTVTVEASQPGDTTYAPAPPQVRSFVIADELQYLSIGPVLNLIAGQGPAPLQYQASSGLPVQVEVLSGPSGLNINNSTQELDYGFTVGTFALRFFQAGDGTYAPAHDIVVPGKIVSAVDPDSPISFATYAQQNSLSGAPLADADNDGSPDILEFARGTDPRKAASSTLGTAHGRAINYAGDKAILWPITYNPRAQADKAIETSSTLDGWQNADLEVLKYHRIVIDGKEVIQMDYALPVTPGTRFVRERVVY